jgi:hypothetical protein
MSQNERLTALNQLRDAVVQGYGDYECTPTKVDVNRRPQLTVHEYGPDRVPRIEPNTRKWRSLRLVGKRSLQDLVIIKEEGRPDVVPPLVYGVIQAGSEPLSARFGVLLGRRTINDIAEQMGYVPIYSAEELI